MKKEIFLSLAAAFAISTFSIQKTHAQKTTTPTWNLSGNSNATLNSVLGTTNGVPLRFITNGVDKMQIDTAGNVSIGRNMSKVGLHIKSDSSAIPLRVTVSWYEKLMLHGNGGLSVGCGNLPPADGLLVAGKVGINMPPPSPDEHFAVKGNALVLGRLAVNNQGENWTGVEAHANQKSGRAMYGEGYVGLIGDGVNTGVIGAGMYGVYGVGIDGTTSRGVSGRGYFGIYGESTSNAFAGYFNGFLYASNFFTPSARKLKRNITDINSASSILAKLQPKEYEYRHDGSFKAMNLPEGKRYGLIAEDLEQVLPNLVKQSKFDTHTPPTSMASKKLSGNSLQPQAGEEIDFKAVSYIELIPIMIKAMQEQAQENNELKTRIAKLEELVNRSSGNALMNTNTRAVKESNTTAWLLQNVPNPATGTTRINYNIPANSRGQLLLSDNSGKTVKTIALNNTGVVDLNTTNLSSGVYHYSLLVDGKTIDTKTLSITR